MPIRLNTNQWVARARAIWGDQYDYSKVDYKKAKTPVIVICPIHGEWKCNPDNHISKLRGCPECGGSQLKTTDDFIRDAQSVHGDTYDYSKARYLNAKEKIGITCPIHGVFWMTPDAHINGKQGCPKCGDTLRGEQIRLTEEDIQDRLAENCEGWDSFVTLLPGTYTGMNQTVATICSKHGRQKPRRVTSLLSSPHPCVECAADSKKAFYTAEDVYRIIHEIFGPKYEVLPFIYRGQNTVLHLICPVEGHGEFSSQWKSMRKSPGCPKCAYQASLENRRKSLRAASATTLQDRFEAWLEAAHETHGDFFEYSKVDFQNYRKSVTIICPIHGEFKQTPYTHLKSGCRKCADEELFGLYNERYFEKHPEKGFSGAIVYYLKFHYRKETWFKVGMTINTIKQRFSVTSKSSVKYEVLGELNTALEDAWRIERDLQRSHGDFFRYRPKLKGSEFSTRDLRLGPSECFSEPIPDDLFEEIFGSGGRPAQPYNA